MFLFYTPNSKKQKVNVAKMHFVQKLHKKSATHRSHRSHRSHPRKEKLTQSVEASPKKSNDNRLKITAHQLLKYCSQCFRRTALAKAMTCKVAFDSFRCHWFPFSICSIWQTHNWFLWFRLLLLKKRARDQYKAQLNAVHKFVQKLSKQNFGKLSIYLYSQLISNVNSKSKKQKKLPTVGAVLWIIASSSKIHALSIHIFFFFFWFLCLPSVCFDCWLLT